MSLCCEDSNCKQYQEIIKQYPRYDCPLMCDDGCIYGDDCVNGTPLPPGLCHPSYDKKNST